MKNEGSGALACRRRACLVLPLRTSPAAKTPGMLVDSVANEEGRFFILHSSFFILNCSLAQC
jgi:hypothetical protein